MQVSEGTAYLKQDDTFVNSKSWNYPPNSSVGSSTTKRVFTDVIELDEYVAFNAGHLPVVGTWTKIHSSQIWLIGVSVHPKR